MYLDIWIHDYKQRTTIIYLSGSLLSISAASVSPVCAALADTVCLDILHITKLYKLILLSTECRYIYIYIATDTK